MNAYTELDAPLGRKAGIAFDHAVLHFDRATHGVDHAPKLDQSAVVRTFDDTTMMHGDGRVDQVAPQRPEPRQRAVLVRAGQTAEPDDISRQDRRYLALAML